MRYREWLLVAAQVLANTHAGPSAFDLEPAANNAPLEKRMVAARPVSGLQARDLKVEGFVKDVHDLQFILGKDYLIQQIARANICTRWTR